MSKPPVVMQGRFGYDFMGVGPDMLNDSGNFSDSQRMEDYPAH